jgi:hypothetical protein
MNYEVLVSTGMDEILLITGHMHSFLKTGGPKIMQNVASSR